MMKFNRIKQLIFTLFLTIMASLFVSTAIYAATAPAPAPASDPSTIITNSACSTNPQALGCVNRSRDPFDIFKKGIYIFISIIAAVSALMIVIGGLRYVLSGGDSAGVKGAKDQIVYALVGLAVSMVAYVIVSFVVSKIGGV